MIVSACLLVSTLGRGHFVAEADFSLGYTCSEYRVPYDGTIQFLPGLFPCRGVAPGPLRVSHLSVHVERVKHMDFLCGIQVLSLWRSSTVHSQARINGMKGV